MSWIQSLGQVRVNLMIIALGSLTVIGLVKLTSLLPEKYYFKFSSLVSSESSPFIVEPPGVSYAKLCTLVEKNRITDHSFTASLDCQKQSVSGPSYGKRNEDAIFRTVFENDAHIRSGLEYAAAHFSLQAMSEKEINNIFTYSRDLGQAINQIESHYRTQVNQQFQRFFLQAYGTKFAELPEDQKPLAQKVVRQAGVSAQSRAVLIKAYQVIAPELGAPLPTLRLQPMTKAKLDELTKHSYSRQAVLTTVSSYYSQQIADHYGKILKTGFARAGLDQNQDRKNLDKAVLQQGIQPYLIAALLRIAPVLLFGLVIGLVFGVMEINSAAVAAALGAFLLAWPVILLWDQLVSYQWQDKRLIFYGFYFVYILSFFVTARLGARIGAGFNRKVTTHSPEITQAAASSGLGFGSKVVRDLLVACIVNALFYIGNAAMPLWA